MKKILHLIDWHQINAAIWLVPNYLGNLLTYTHFISKHKLVGLFSSDDSKNDGIKTSFAYCNKNGYTSNRDINWIKIWDCVHAMIYQNISIPRVVKEQK